MREGLAHWLGDPIKRLPAGVKFPNSPATDRQAPVGSHSALTIHGGGLDLQRRTSLSLEVELRCDNSRRVLSLSCSRIPPLAGCMLKVFTSGPASQQASQCNCVLGHATYPGDHAETFALQGTGREAQRPRTRTDEASGHCLRANRCHQSDPTFGPDHCG